MITAAHELEATLLDLMNRRPPDRMKLLYNQHFLHAGVEVKYSIGWFKSITITYEFATCYFDEKPSINGMFRVSLNSFGMFSPMSYKSSEFKDNKPFVEHAYRYYESIIENVNAAFIANEDIQRNRVIKFLKRAK